MFKFNDNPEFAAQILLEQQAMEAAKTKEIDGTLIFKPKGPKNGDKGKRSNQAGQTAA